MSIKWIYLLFLGGLLLLGPGVSAQLVSTVAGQAETTGNIDGAALTQALFNNPHGICSDARGRVYIADRWNHKIRVLNTHTGMVSTLAGTGAIGDDDGPGATARFYEPWGITCTDDGTVYVADTKNYLIRKIDTLGNVTTIAGTGAFGVVNGPAMTARFAEPSGIALADDGTLYICDHLGHTIRKLSTGGVVTTIAGTAFVDGDVDGAGAAARFYRPFDIDMDNNGNLLVADEWNHKIRRVTPTGFTTTVAGMGSKGSDDGPAGQARFNFPWDVLMDANGDIFVMDGFNYTIRKISNDTVSTYCGTTRNTGAQDGFGDQASFSGATAICYDPVLDVIYVGDAYNDLIRRVDRSTGVSLFNDLNLASADTVCAGTELVFDAQPADYASYDFYVGGTLLQSNVSSIFSYTFNTAGTYMVKVNATHNDGWAVESPEFSVVAVAAPNGNFTYEILQTGPGNNQIRFLPSDTSAAAYFWDFGDPASGNANTSRLKRPVHTYPDSGPYSVRLITSNGGSCRDTVYKADFVGILGLNVSPIQAQDTICLGTSVSFEASAKIYNSYRFFVNGSQVANSATPTYTSTPAAPGDYQVYVEGVDANGQVFQSPAFGFYVAALPVADYSWQQIGLENQRYRIDFVDLSSNARSRQWRFGDQPSGPLNSSAQPNASHLYPAPGRYDLQLISIGSGGCRDTLLDVAGIVVSGLLAQRQNALGEWENVAPGDTLCIGDELQLLGQPTDFQQYDFYLEGDLLQSSGTQSYDATLSQAGWYRFQLTGEDADGQRYNSGDWTVYATPKPVADFRVLDQRLSPQGLVVDFAPLDMTYASYAWDFGDPLAGATNQSTLIQPTHTYADFGRYNVRLTVDAGGGCSSSLQKAELINFKDEPGNLFVPNAFTPNGDGQNDVLHLYGNNITALEWSIYNEWGEQVFMTRTPGQGWDGTFRGKAVAADTYVYMAKVSLANGQNLTLQGQTTLLR